MKSSRGPTVNSVILGDCVAIMAGMEPASFDAIITDPPYGLEFMGKEWDRFAAPTGGASIAEARLNGVQMGIGL